MKNLAKQLAVAMTILSVMFIGCKNFIDASVGDSSEKNTAGKIEKLTVVATSDDSLVKFSSSRTVLPGALVASDLTFYLWGTDVNDNSNTSITTPQKVQFNPTDDTTGSVPVNLSVSSYKLKLAAAFSAGGGDSLSTVADILEKAVVYGVADVDLRYNQTVKFYLNPANISGTGTVDIKLRTLDAWKNDKYSVTVRIENKTNNAIVNNKDLVSSEQSWYTIGQDWSTENASNLTAGVSATALATATGVEYKIDKIPAGTYNLVVDFWNSTTPGTGKHFYYSDTLMVLTGQISNKTNSSTATDYVEIPDVIDSEPDAPENLRIGYNDPVNRDTGYFLATLEWDDTAYNEEYFVLEVMDVTNCTGSEDSGFDAATDTALAEIMSAAPNDTPTDILTDGWKTLAADTRTILSKFDYTVYQKTDSQYAAGSLCMNSSSVSLWLELGHSYVARLTAVNEASSPIDETFDKLSTTSSHKWIYSNLASMTGTAPRAVVTEITTGGLSGTPSQPKSWTEDGTPGNGDEPLAINRYRIEYSLNGGKFQAVTQYGVPLNWDAPTQVTDVEGIQKAYYNYITSYGTITANGTAIIDPTIWPKASSGSGIDYITLYNAKYSFKSWYETEISANPPYSKLEFTVNDSESDASQAYVVSDYGKINIQGVIGFDGTVATKWSLDGHIYNGKVMNAPVYKKGTNIFLVANFGSESGGVALDIPEFYKPHSQNIRLFKSKGTMNASYPFSATQADSEAAAGLYTYDSSNICKTAVVDYPGTYTDGEVTPGTFKLSSYWESISVLVVENALQKDNKDIYRSVTVEIVDTSGDSPKTSNQALKDKFIVKKTSPLIGSVTEAISGDNVGSAGTAGSDPLYYYYTNATTGTDTEKLTHTAYYVVISTKQFTAGHKYKIRVKTNTDENPKVPYVYSEIVFEFTDPEYEDSAYEVADVSDESNFNQFYQKNGETYTLAGDGIKPSVNPASITLYKLTGTPKY